MSQLHLTWCSLRSLLFVLFTEITEKFGVFLRGGWGGGWCVWLVGWFFPLVACSISEDCYYHTYKSPFLQAKQTKFLWVLSLVTYFLKLCSLLLLSMTLQLFNTLFICTLFICSAEKQRQCYGLMIFHQGRQFYLSPFKSALWNPNFSFSQTMGIAKWWSESPN